MGYALQTQDKITVFFYGPLVQQGPMVIDNYHSNSSTVLLFTIS